MSDDAFGWLQDDREPTDRPRGLGISELLDLPESLRALMVEITRYEPVGLAELAEALHRDLVELEIQMYQLVARGWLDVQEDESGRWIYQARIEQARKRLLPPGIWQVLDDRWQIPIFRLFPDAMREEFSNAFHLEQHRAGTILFEAGAWGDRMYMVETGKIEGVMHDVNGQPFVVQEIGPGGVLGEVAVLLGERRPYTARVAEKAQIWALAKPDLDRLLSRHPDVGLTIRHELSRQFIARRPGSISRTADARRRHNPVIAVGAESSALARHLAGQASDQVVLIDLTGKPPDPSPNLTCVDGRRLHSQDIIQQIHDGLDRDAWVVVSLLPEMTDQMLRVIELGQVIVDMTGSGARWLRAMAGRYRAVPAGSPARLARLARQLGGRVTGLVLSGGAARTMAHLGVLDVLHQAEVPIDVIASCGYGALWSVLYAAEWSPAQLIDLAVQQASRLRPFAGRLGFRAASRPGLFDARSVRTWIQGIVGELGFADLEVPCRIAAWDLRAGQTVWIGEGAVFPALSACVATPGLVTPIERQEQLLADALLSDPVPIDAMAGDGVDVMLVSSAIPSPGAQRHQEDQESHLPGLVVNWLGVCDAVAHECSLKHLHSADLVIAPEVADLSDAAFDQAPILIERGRRAAEKALPRIRSLLQQKEQTR